MNRVDITPLIDNGRQYSEISQRLSDRYECEWDDDVHDSFRGYVKQVQEYAGDLKEICNRTEILNKEVEELGLDEIIQDANDLCRKAETI